MQDQILRRDPNLMILRPKNYQPGGRAAVRGFTTFHLDLRFVLPRCHPLGNRHLLEVRPFRNSGGFDHELLPGTVDGGGSPERGLIGFA